MTDRDRCSGGADGSPPPPAELRAILARLRQAEGRAVAPVTSAWVDRVVAVATADATPPSAVAAPPAEVARPRRVAPWRAVAAATLAFLGLHAGAVAMSAATVVVVAGLVWPERRNSLQTMTPEDAIELLQRIDQPDDARARAALHVASQLRANLGDLLRVCDDAAASPVARAAAEMGLGRVRSRLLQPAGTPWSATQPIGLLRADARVHIVDAATAQVATEHALALIVLLQGAPVPGRQLQEMQSAMLNRLRDYVRS
ncbi:MAG: hypothetical protein ACK58X_05905 [Planctomycetota bacterium]